LVPTVYDVAKDAGADTVVAIVKNALDASSSSGFALIIKGAAALSASEKEEVAVGMRAILADVDLYKAIPVDPTPEAIEEAAVAGLEPPQPEIPPPPVTDRSSIVIFSSQVAMLPEDLPIQRCTFAAVASAADE
jgi:hypothetical protein